MTGSNQHLTISRTNLVRTVIEYGMAESIHLILRHAGQLRSETLADTRCQLFRIERFGKIIVRLQLESLQAVSLVAAVGKKKDEETTKADITIEVLNDRFTPLQLINEWKAYAENLTEELHLRNTMLNCLPNLIANTVFEVIVNNPVQEQRLLEYQMDILSRLRAQLRNTHLRMEVRISENNEKKLAFTPAEKFNLMMEENESLRRLKDEFGLELS